MKTKNIVLTVVIILASVVAYAICPEVDINIDSEPVKYYHHDPYQFINDKWISYQEDMTYELSFEADTIRIDNYNMMCLKGTMVYKKWDGTVVRRITNEKHPVYHRRIWGGPVASTTSMAIFFSDPERDVHGKGGFKLNDDNGDRATWNLVKNWGDGTFDLPQKMTFHRNGLPNTAVDILF